MYSLDINLLSERPEYRSGKQTQSQFTSGPTTTTSQYGKVPIYIGAGVTVLSLLAIGGTWLWTGQQTTQLEAKQQELDRKLGSLKAQDQQLQQINAEVAQINDETQALASVFNQIQPWSAVLQDLRESIPQGVQIANVAQTEVKADAPAAGAAPAPAAGGGLAKKITTPPNPEASPPPGASPAPAASTPAVPTSTPPTATLAAEIPTTKLDITGTAKSFEEVNNFILTLKQSAFFNPDDTQLLSASLTDAVALTKVPLAKEKELTEQDLAAADKLNRLELPKVVDYKIQTSLKRIPATDLIRELERKGAVGLVTRLRSLQQQQVIK